MPFRFPRRFIYGDAIIDANSINTFPEVGGLPSDPMSIRFRSIAEIMLRGIQRYVAADRELQDESGRTSNTDEPVLGNLGDSLPEPLDFVFEKPLSVSDVSETPGFGEERDIQNGGKS
jgi:hypothetical protein